MEIRIMSVVFIISITILMFLSSLLFNEVFFAKWLYANEKSNEYKKFFVAKIVLILAYFADILAFILIFKSVTPFRMAVTSIPYFSLFLIAANEKYFNASGESNILRNLKRRNIFYIIAITLNCMAFFGSALRQHGNLLFAIPALVVAATLITISCIWTRKRVKRFLNREIEKNSQSLTN